MYVLLLLLDWQALKQEEGPYFTPQFLFMWVSYSRCLYPDYRALNGMGRKI
jgi:hypothetical protein